MVIYSKIGGGLKAPIPTSPSPPLRNPPPAKILNRGYPILDKKYRK